MIDAVVAGHICLDIIPTLNAAQSTPETLFVPGRLLAVGPATVSLGGAVANAGIALHRLGISTSLIGKVGSDQIGQATIASLQRIAPHLAEGMFVSQDESSSYSIVLNPPGVDRCFLHHTGTNDSLVAADIDTAAASAGRIFHFGYPTLLAGTFQDGGQGLAEKLQEIQRSGVITCLDMAMPDPDSEAGRTDWRRWFETVLPAVDLFLPSLDEILMKLQREKLRELQVASLTGNPAQAASGDLLQSVANELLDMGAHVVGLKLGDEGLYLRAGLTDALSARSKWNGYGWRDWQNRELLAPCYQVSVKGTTGSGDCTVAGFLAGLLRGASLEGVIHSSVGVGACNVEQPDATSGIPSFESIQARIQGGWPQRKTGLDLGDGWSYRPEYQLFECR